LSGKSEYNSDQVRQDFEPHVEIAGGEVNFIAAAMKDRGAD
jgi:hypothetical protein